MTKDIRVIVYFICILFNCGSVKPLPPAGVLKAWKTESFDVQSGRDGATESHIPHGFPMIEKRIFSSLKKIFSSSNNKSTIAETDSTPMFSDRDSSPAQHIVHGSSKNAGRPGHRVSSVVSQQKTKYPRYNEDDAMQYGVHSGHMQEAANIGSYYNIYGSPGSGHPARYEGNYPHGYEYYNDQYYYDEYSDDYYAE
ncbi:unnamed protein product [Dicrocoelium dendriticum]|nr:unnamed protein product [Dicrocoelium dendriticum]